MRSRWWHAVFGALAMVPAAEAQVITGTVVEQASGTPLGGVIVTLARVVAPDSTEPLYSALTAENGTYTIRAPGPGQFEVSAKRIGVTRVVLPAFQLALGDTQRLDITLQPLVYTLPEIAVRRVQLCALRPNEMPRLTALWDEAFAALTNARIAERDSLFSAHIVRHVRLLDRRNLRVLQEDRRERDGLVHRPFSGLDPDSLSSVGYWRELAGDTIAFYGPDVDDLLSDAFRVDHCFRIVEDTKRHPQQIGVAFEPAPKRTVPDITGTLWLDARTFALGAVEFQYTRLPTTDYSDRVGGAVYFARLPNGAWIVRRWYLRMPQYTTHVYNEGGFAKIDVIVYEARVNAILEEGGEATASDMELLERPATVTGVARDSLNHPWAGVAVALLGTAYATTTDATGGFRLDSVPPGTYAVAVQAMGYDAFREPAIMTDVTLEEGRIEKLTLRADGMMGFATRLCGGHRPAAKLATLRILLVDQRTESPVANVALRISWKEYGRSVGGVAPVVERDVAGTSDTRGIVTFCNLPPDAEITVELPQGNRTPLFLDRLRLQASSAVARSYNVTP